MPPPPLRFLLRTFRFSFSARWLSRCRAAVAVAELFAAAAAGDTLRCCFLALLSCPPPLVLVLVMLLFFVLLYSSGESTATVTALQSGRSPKRRAAWSLAYAASVRTCHLLGGVRRGKHRQQP